MITRAVELPEVRAHLASWLAKYGPGIYEEFLRRGMLGWGGKKPEPTPENAEALANGEIHRLLKADLYWVDSHMTDLVISAAPSLPEFKLLPEDLPSPYGMLVFEKPLRVLPAADGFADKVHITAVVWGQLSAVGAPYDGAWISWYSDTARNLATRDPVRPFPKGWKRLDLPPLSYDNEGYIPYSDGPLAEESHDYPSAELHTAWALMQQPIAKVSDAEFDRATRRRLQRQKIEPKPVRVITLRRPSSTGEHGDTDREYHHQWIVRGHWRQQWYPARGVHRPVWIAPHVKGPEGAPLLGGDKVYSWTR